MADYAAHRASQMAFREAKRLRRVKQEELERAGFVVPAREPFMELARELFKANAGVQFVTLTALDDAEHVVFHVARNQVLRD